MFQQGYGAAPNLRRTFSDATSLCGVTALAGQGDLLLPGIGISVTHPPIPAISLLLLSDIEPGTIILSQNFDGVTAPALPAGWVNTAQAGSSAWVTSTTTPHSAPNAAFAPNPGTVTDTTLDSPGISVPAGGARLSFMNFYTMESTFDGVVLEISINGGAFQDITTGGNAFIAGGYTGPISTAFGNPIGGRQAWSGTSSTYITSTINLPAAANGQSVKLRWRAATDNSVSATGVRIDGVTVTAN